MVWCSPVQSLSRFRVYLASELIGRKAMLRIILSSVIAFSSSLALPNDLAQQSRTVLYLPSFDPYAVVKDEQLQGYIPSIIETLNRSSEIKISLWEASFARSLQLFHRNQTDLTFGNLDLIDTSYFRQLKGLAYFELINDRYTVVFHSGSFPDGLGSIADLKGKKMVLTRGSRNPQGKIQNLAGEIEYTVDSQSLLKMVARGRADFSVVTELTYKQFIRKQPALNSQLAAFSQTFPLSLGIVVKKSNQKLCSSIKNSLDKLMRNGDIQVLLEKSFKDINGEELKSYKPDFSHSESNCD